MTSSLIKIALLAQKTDTQKTISNITHCRTNSGIMDLKFRAVFQQHLIIRQLVTT